MLTDEGGLMPAGQAVTPPMIVLIHEGRRVLFRLLSTEEKELPSGRSWLRKDVDGWLYSLLSHDSSVVSCSTCTSDTSRTPSTRRGMHHR